jgi:hypothetical protein
MTALRRQQLRVAVKKIEALHKLGRRQLSRAGQQRSGDEESVADEARRRGINVEKLRQARRVADAYTPADLKRLCATIMQAIKDQNAKAQVVGPTAVIRLLSIPQTHREEYLRRAVQNGWSVRTLEAEIRRVFGRRRLGRRRRKVPTDLFVLYAEIEAECERWRRWSNKLKTADSHAGQIVLQNLPKDARSGFEKAYRAIGSLQEDVAAALARSRARSTNEHRRKGPPTS